MLTYDSSWTPTLQSFESFPRLPMEIRLLIWRYCFPPSRQVTLFRPFETWTFGGAPSPVTLYVNSESRKETLKHYYLLDVHDVPSFSEYGFGRHLDAFTREPICFDPSKDFLHIDCCILSRPTKDFFVFEWLPYVASTIRGGLATIKYLEFRDIWLDNLTWHRGESYPKATGSSDISESLPCFTGLETLVLMLMDGRFGTDPELLARLRQLLKGQSYEKFLCSGSKPPKKVIIRSYKAMHDFTWKDKTLMKAIEAGPPNEDHETVIEEHLG